MRFSKKIGPPMREIASTSWETMSTQVRGIALLIHTRQHQIGPSYAVYCGNLRCPSLDQLQEEKKLTSNLPPNMHGAEILEGNVYNLVELDRIDQGIAPASNFEELNIIGEATEGV